MRSQRDGFCPVFASYCLVVLQDVLRHHQRNILSINDRMHQCIHVHHAKCMCVLHPGQVVVFSKPLFPPSVQIDSAAQTLSCPQTVRQVRDSWKPTVSSKCNLWNLQRLPTHDTSERLITQACWTGTLVTWNVERDDLNDVPDPCFSTAWSSPDPWVLS